MASIARPGTIVRPVVHEPTGVWSWITTIDHKRIGILYGVTAGIFLLFGGIEALLIRIQLARPDQHVVGPLTYNELFTMHGTTMIFLAIMPLGTTFLANYIVPLQIGARDVAFPRLNAFSYWVFLAGGILLNLGWVLGAAPDGGWYGYAPNTELMFNPGRNIDFYVVGLLVLGVGTVAASLNFIVTIFNLRAPGLAMMRLPIFTWATLITAILTVLAFPALTVALILLWFDRYAGTHFYLADVFDKATGQWVLTGGDPLLWQHLFWVFGHPEVYIMILPAFGIISEVVPIFSRKPLFGYAVMVYALCAIAFLSFGVWAHHMFTTGLGPTPDSLFSATSMLIAIPTGIKIFNWLGTMFFGSIKFTTAMLFAVAFVAQFTIGGITGVMEASPAVDSHHNDSYMVVAHFHYVLFGGTMFAVLSAVYYWYPKFSGHMLNEHLGKWNFWLTFIGFNATFFPMHFLGLEGMPRRYYTYGPDSGWGTWSLVVSISAFVLAFAFVLLIINVVRSWSHGQPAGPNPWDGATLEWATASPPPAYNFPVIPTVRHRDPLWWEKYGRQEGHAAEQTVVATVAGKPIATAEAPDEAPLAEARTRASSGDVGHIHMPNPSYYPLISALGLFLAGLGLLIDNPDLTIGLLHLPILCLIGLIVLLWGTYGWAFEPAG